MERQLASVTRPISYKYLIEEKLCELALRNRNDADMAIVDMLLVLGGEYLLVDMCLSKDMILTFLLN